MLQTLVLTPLTEASLSQVVALDQLCFGGLWTAQAYQGEFRSNHSTLLGLMTAQGLLGVGCLWSILEEAHITLLAVHPEHQKRGFGSALIWGLLNQARSLGLEWATLEVRASNTCALNLYRKFGFQEVGRRRNYYPDTGEDGIVLWRAGLDQGEFQGFLETQWRECSAKLNTGGWHWQLASGLAAPHSFRV